jgi:uncharacterized protein with WD repeat
MPHTTTKVSRIKRIDVRPNSRQRKSIAAIIDSKTTIKELRVTRKSKEERMERNISLGQEIITSKKSRNEKVVRSLRKKLKAIELLISKQRSGEELDEQQLEKVNSLDQIMKDIEQFIPEN